MAASGTVQVVVADDDAAVRAALRDLLADTDAVEVVAEAADASGAVAACAAHRPHVVVLDVRMPGDGLDAAREIAAAGTAERIVVLTAAEEPEVRQRALTSGASFFLLKSDGDDLVAAITGS